MQSLKICKLADKITQIVRKNNLALWTRHCAQHQEAQNPNHQHSIATISRALLEIMQHAQTS